MHYAAENLCAKPENLRGLQEYRSARTLLLDPATLRNLEIFTSSRTAARVRFSPRSIATASAAGRRLLERWMAAPVLDLPEIRRRQALVPANSPRSPRGWPRPASAWARSGIFRASWAACRTACAIPANSRHPRHPGPAARDPRGSSAASAPARSSRPSPPASGNSPRCRTSSPRPWPTSSRPTSPRAGWIRPGHDAELDRLRGLTSGNKTWLSELERAEQERTGIRGLKVKFTGNFGYYLGVWEPNLHLVPSDYIRRQTTVGGGRYITEGLRLKEKEIFHAEENALARERDLFQELIAAALAEAGGLAAAAEALAELDVLAGWAVLAREANYCRPELDEGEVLEITEGRHPVVEQMLQAPEARLGGAQAFVPNDVLLACDDAQIALLTGPNMAGKSTYIRQVALLTLLAQIGCWVPARACRIGLVDRIFSRVGASDDLARGNSTFMVEMNETANILNNATDRSLIVLDEIGRGTSTYDGLAIAWAIVEHLHRDPAQGPRTLFATHYQELTQLAKHPLAAPAQFLGQREGMERGDRLRPAGVPGRRRPQLRDPGRAAGGASPLRHRPRAGDPRPARGRGGRRGGARPPGPAEEENHPPAAGRRRAARPAIKTPRTPGAAAPRR